MEVGHKSITATWMEGDPCRKSEAQSVREGILRQKLGGKRRSWFSEWLKEGGQAYQLCDCMTAILSENAPKHRNSGRSKHFISLKR